MNSKINTVTGFSPFVLVFGKAPNLDETSLGELTASDVAELTQ